MGNLIFKTDAHGDSPSRMLEIWNAYLQNAMRRTCWNMSSIVTFIQPNLRKSLDQQEIGPTILLIWTKKGQDSLTNHLFFVMDSPKNIDKWWNIEWTGIVLQSSAGMFIEVSWNIDADQFIIAQDFLGLSQFYLCSLINSNIIKFNFFNVDKTLMS